jgi:zinc transport system permease protein
MIDALQNDFMRHAVYAGLLASVACGIIGTYVVVNRIVFISGGIAHASFGGIGLGYYVGALTPIQGALIFTLASALGIGVVVRKIKLPEDSVIGILWAMGMALGILLIFLTPGRAPDLFSYLFGTIVIVPFSDLVLMIILDFIIVATVIALYKELLALSFDKEFSTVIGIPVERLYLLLLCMIALTVVLLIRVVGIILVIALLTIPPTLARQFTHDIRKMMLLSIIFGMLFSFGGLWLAYEFDIPAGATIILFSGAVLILTLAFSRMRGKRHMVRDTESATVQSQGVE